MSDDERQGPLEKAAEIKDDIGEKLEPTEEELSQAGGPANASSPFSGGERSDEQPAG